MPILYASRIFRPRHFTASFLPRRGSYSTASRAPIHAALIALVTLTALLFPYLIFALGCIYLLSLFSSIGRHDVVWPNVRPRWCNKPRRMLKFQSHLSSSRYGDLTRTANIAHQALMTTIIPIETTLTGFLTPMRPQSSTLSAAIFACLKYLFRRTSYALTLKPRSF